MIQAKTGAADLGVVAPQEQPKRAGDTGGNQGGDDRFAQTLQSKRREMEGGQGSDRKAGQQANAGDGAKESTRADKARADDGKAADKGEKAEEKAAERSEKTAEKQADKAGNGRDAERGTGERDGRKGEAEKEQAADKPRLELPSDGKKTAADADGTDGTDGDRAQRATDEARRELAAADAKAEDAERATDEDGKELPEEEQVVAGLVVSQAAKEGARKAQQGEADGPAGRESVRPRVLEAVADTSRGNGRPGERGSGSEADRRFFQGLQERLGEQRAMQDGESLVKNASKQESERSLQGFLRTLQQANARDAGASQGTQTQAGAVSPTATPTGQNAPTAPPTLNLQTPVNQQGWDRALGERVAWMAKDGMQEARIQLHPRNMGPIEVRLSVNQDQASVHFTAQHGMTRDAIEQAMPRLREMLAEQGLNLADSEVADQGPQGREQTGEGLAGGTGGDGDPDGLAARDGETDGDAEEGLAGEAVIAPSGLDYYA